MNFFFNHWISSVVFWGSSSSWSWVEFTWFPTVWTWGRMSYGLPYIPAVQEAQAAGDMRLAANALMQSLATPGQWLTPPRSLPVTRRGWKDIRETKEKKGKAKCTKTGEEVTLLHQIKHLFQLCALWSSITFFPLQRGGVYFPTAS